MYIYVCRVHLGALVHGVREPRMVPESAHGRVDAPPAPHVPGGDGQTSWSAMCGKPTGTSHTRSSRRSRQKWPVMDITPQSTQLLAAVQVTYLKHILCGDTDNTAQG